MHIDWIMDANMQEQSWGAVRRQEIRFQAYKTY
jgi:hypothetical protein